MAQAKYFLSHISKLTPWIFSFCISLNLIRYHSLDIIFTLAALSAAYYSINKKKSFFESAFLKPNIFNIFAILFLISSIIGHINYSPPFISTEGLKAILDLRWFFGLYCCIYIGKSIRMLNFPFNLNSALYVITLIALLFWQYTNLGFFNLNNRLQGFFENPNHLSLTLVLAWAFFIPFSLQKQIPGNSFPYLNFITLITIGLCLFATYSRSAWFGAVVAYFVATLYMRKKSMLISIVVSLILILTAFYSNLFQIKDRVMGTLDISTTGVEAGRISVWKVSWEIFKDHPLFGTGQELAQKLYPEYYKKMGIPTNYIVGHAHNQYLQILSESGLLGIVSYIGTFIVAAVYFHRRFKDSQNSNERNVALAAILVIVALFASSFTDAPFRLHECRNYVLLMLGMSFGYLSAPTNKNQT